MVVPYINIILRDKVADVDVSSGAFFALPIYCSLMTTEFSEERQPEGGLASVRSGLILEEC